MLKQLKYEQKRKISALEAQYEKTINEMMQDQTVKLESGQESEASKLRERLDSELELLMAAQSRNRMHLASQHDTEKKTLQERLSLRRAVLEQKIEEELAAFDSEQKKRVSELEARQSSELQSFDDASNKLGIHHSLSISVPATPTSLASSTTSSASLDSPMSTPRHLQYPPEHGQQLSQDSSARSFSDSMDNMSAKSSTENVNHHQYHPSSQAHTNDGNNRPLFSHAPANSTPSLIHQYQQQKSQQHNMQHQHQGVFQQKGRVTQPHGSPMPPPHRHTQGYHRSSTCSGILTSNMSALTTSTNSERCSNSTSVADISGAGSHAGKSSPVARTLSLLPTESHQQHPHRSDPSSVGGGGGQHQQQRGPPLPTSQPPTWAGQGSRQTPPSTRFGLGGGGAADDGSSDSLSSRSRSCSMTPVEIRRQQQMAPSSSARSATTSTTVLCNATTTEPSAAAAAATAAYFEQRPRDAAAARNGEREANGFSRTSSTGAGARMRDGGGGGGIGGRRGLDSDASPTAARHSMNVNRGGGPASAELSRASSLFIKKSPQGSNNIERGSGGPDDGSMSTRGNVLVLDNRY